MSNKKQLIIYAVVIIIFGILAILVANKMVKMDDVEEIAPEPSQISTEQVYSKLNDINDNLLIINGRLLRIETRATENKLEIMEEYSKLADQMNELTVYLVTGEGK